MKSNSIRSIIGDHATFTHATPKAFLIVLLALTAAVGLALFATSKAAIPAVTQAPGAGDSATYRRIVERMRGGAGYYSAAHQTLLADDYGTASVFNWRTPTWAELLAHLPSIRWAQGLLAGLAMISVLLPIALLGFVAWPKGLRSGLFVVTYLGLFAIIGKPFNTYWGALYTPVLMLGPAWGLYAIYEGLFSHDHNAGVT